MPHCTTNISLPYEGELITVTLSVDFEVSPADPSVGIFGNGVECFTAKVIDADDGTDTIPLSVFQGVLQGVFDRMEDKYRDEIDEACIESLSDYYDPREEP